MERTTPELSDATGLKTPTSDRAKRLLLNLKSAEADSLLTPAQKDDRSWLHFFQTRFPTPPRPQTALWLYLRSTASPSHSGRFKNRSPISLLSCLENNSIFAANLDVSAFYLAAHQGMVQ